MIETAKPALDRGFRIHPCHPRSKEPMWSGWPRRATSDPAEVEKWDVPQDSNYGVVATSDGICILESDDLPALVKLLGWELPPTFTVQATEGHPHFYFEQTAATRSLGNCVRPGIFEFKQNNCYVIGPGCAHPSGRIYQIIRDLPVAVFPDWLVGELNRLRGGSKVGGRKVAEDEVLGEGEGRHYILMSEAGRLWDGEKTQEEMFEQLQAFNEKHCDPPRDAGHLMQMIEYVMEREPNYKTAHVVLNQKFKPRGPAKVDLSKMEKGSDGIWRIKS